ncbi:hypothetical protein BVY04_02500 [bacterium M21]|nr:hypothetical protein BVY04_02500 [bacterium M21]
MVRRLVWLFFLCGAVVSAVAGETGHYVNGVEGVRGSALPPPGFYYRMYNQNFQANRLMDGNGDEVNIGFNVDVWATVHRLVLITDHKFLGADYGCDIVFPFIRTDLDVDLLGVHDRDEGLGDINVEPLVLAWHGKQWDAAFGYSIYAPTGGYGANEPASIGKDFWSQMITVGTNVYFDEPREWHASLLARYEIHHEKQDEEITPGNDFHFEWGLGKTVGQIVDVGVAGYCQWQVTDDKGDDATNTEDRDRLFGIGPDVNVFIPPYKMFVGLRYITEFDAIDRPEGDSWTLTLTWIF